MADREPTRFERDGKIAGAVDRVIGALTRRRFAEVVPGRLYRSGAMSEKRLTAVTAKYGIRTVIDLRRDSPEVDAERGVLERLGVAHVRLPSKQVPTPEQVEMFRQWMSEPGGGPVLVHCTHGRGRAMLFAILYLIDFKGIAAEQALRRYPWRSTFGNMAPASRKGRFIREYVPVRDRGEL